MPGKPLSSEDATKPILAQFIVFFLTASLLSFIQLRVDPPMLIVERFVPGWGWFEILALSLYAGFIAGKMLRPTQSPRWRLRIWLLFSVVFFSKLLIGLLGVDQFLMTGTLHLPIPTMIVAGPIFRAEGFFMPILFASTQCSSESPEYKDKGEKNENSYYFSPVYRDFPLFNFMFR